MLDASELADIRSFATNSLISQATIKRQVRVSDGRGGSTVTWENVKSVPCRLVEQRDANNSSNSGVTLNSGESILYLPYGTTIDEKARVEVVVNGHTRTITVTRVIENSHTTLTTLLVEEVR